MPSAAASRGVRMRTGFPSHRICPCSGLWIPAMHLMSTDFPAPLSPMSAVTSPERTSRSTSVSACTGPKFFDTPCKRSRGSAPFTVLFIGSFRDSKASGPGPSTRGPAQPAGLLDSCLLALAGEVATADVGHLDDAILDDRVGHVVRRDPDRDGIDGFDVLV